MIGLISDTHGLLRQEVVDNLNNCNLIIHAGDIGKFEVIENLKKISNVEFIRGNCDKDKSIAKEDRIVEIYNKRIYLIHDISKININLKEDNIDIVVYGHSHKPNIYEDNDILYINPGSVGPRRFKLPISMAKLKVLGDASYYDSLKLIDENIYRYKCYEVEFIPIAI
ncbi:metallophosphoesterase family protein [Romboutsia sp. 13368]|uniref:metallophosphoesterase family protein n=1 Tax=Romboutsia sp. 13368 TaxID=2708053 RepID=UPI0025EC95C1|nr:metallophosphoesterase family protein [Romboutsia sp. 13368]